MPDATSPVFVYQLLLVILAAANALGGLGTFITAVRGRPMVSKEDFERHQAHVSARLNGTNDKIDALESKTQDDLKSLVSTLGHINADLQRVVGRLEGQVEKSGRKT